MYCLDTTLARNAQSPSMHNGCVHCAVLNGLTHLKFRHAAQQLPPLVHAVQVKSGIVAQLRSSVGHPLLICCSSLQGGLVDQLRDVVRAREASIAQLHNEQHHANVMLQAVRAERDRLQHEVCLRRASTSSCLTIVMLDTCACLFSFLSITALYLMSSSVAAACQLAGI